MILILIIVCLAAFCAFWIREFAELMLLEDRLFSGRFDKIIWAAVFVMVAPLAPFAFCVWKAARTAENAVSPVR
jgi:hypothetical protein